MFFVFYSGRKVLFCGKILRSRFLLFCRIYVFSSWITALEPFGVEGFQQAVYFLVSRVRALRFPGCSRARTYDATVLFLWVCVAFGARRHMVIEGSFSIESNRGRHA